MNTTSATPAPEQNPSSIQRLRYVARQPIFDREKRVFGYELLFRDGVENAFTSGDADMASRATLDRSVLVGLDMLCDGKRAFVNCTRDTLIKGLVTLLPANSTVVEVLESVSPDPDVMAAVERLKESGYMIALDDFVMNDAREPLAEMADIIKVELKLTTAEQRIAMVKRYGPWKRRMLAEKVETQEEFAAAREMGFVYFQGYFFRRPEMISANEMPANRMNYLRMLQAVSSPDLDMQQLEQLIKGEASICYRLLRYLNSPMFGFRNEIHSVKHGLAILGEREMRRWVRLVAAVGAGQDSSSDLLLSSLVRARFAELVSPKVAHGDSDLFLMGLLSLIDAMLEMPMEKVVEMLPLDKDTRMVLLGQPSALRPVHQLMLAHESGEWEAAARVAESMHLKSEEIAGLYLQAQQWAREVSLG
ncbi:MAG TPA: HDOD domain-containing protein [Candidatus Sulfotelmatobacter sp.]